MYYHRFLKFNRFPIHNINIVLANVKKNSENLNGLS